MRGNGGLAGFSAVAVAVGALWFFGRAQPIEVVERNVQPAGSTVCPTCQGQKRTVCKACNGGGRTAATEHVCSACGGTGKGEWQMSGPRRVKRMGSDPVCAPCRGTGRVGVSQMCPACSGARMAACPGCAGTGCTQAAAQTVRTVQAGHSLWERVMAWLYMPPDDDAAPQVGPAGRVPMIDAYLALFQRNGVSGRVVKWGAVSRGANGWEVRAQLRIRRGEAESEEGRLFVVRNRQVISATPLAWP